MRSLNWIPAMNQDPPTHLLLCLSSDVLYEYISIKIVYFHLIYYQLFFVVKVVVASLPQVKCLILLPHDVTVNKHYHVTMGR